MSNKAFNARHGISVGSTPVDVINNAGELLTNSASATKLKDTRTFEISGDVVASAVNFDGTGNVNLVAAIQPDSVVLGTDTTGNYMVDVSAGTGVSVSHTQGEGSTATISIGQAVATSNSPTFANLTLTGELKGPAIFVIDPTVVGNNTGKVVIKGDLQIDGTTTTLNSTTVTIDDPIFTLGGDTAPADDDTLDKGIEFRWFDSEARLGFFGFDRSTGKFTFIPQAANTNNVFAGTTGEIDAKLDWSNVLNKPTIDNTTYNILAVTATSGALLRLNSSGNVNDDVKFASGTNVSVAYTDDNTITISSTDTNTTYSVKASAQTNGAGIDLDAGGSGSGTDTVKILGSGGTTVAHTDADTITISSTSVGDGTLTVEGASAGATNTHVALQLSGAYSANSSTNRTIKPVVGPALSSLAAIMTGATTGLLKKTGEDTYTIDTSTYITTDTNTTYSLDGQSTAANDVDIQLVAGGSGSGTDAIKIVGSGATTVSWDESNQKITISSTDTDTNTVTRLRGTASGTYTSGDLTLVAGSNVTVTQNGSDYTIAASQPTVNNGTLSITTKTAGASGTDVTLELSGAYSANTSDNRTIKAVVGPALTALATLMSTAGPGFIRRTATADTFSVDTNTYLTAEADTLATVTARGATTSVVSSFTGGGGDASPALRITQTSGAATFNWVGSFLNSAINGAAGRNAILLIGQAESSKNSGYYGFNWQGNSSNSNFLTFGLFGVDNVFNIFGSGNSAFGTTTAPTAKVSIVSGTPSSVNALELKSNTKHLSPDGTKSVTTRMLDTGVLTFSGSTGQLFSVADSMTGTIFAVNDVSGIPSIEVFDTGKVQIAELSGNVLLGSSTDNGVDKLQVNGSARISTALGIGGSAGTAYPLYVQSSQRYIAGLKNTNASNYWWLAHDSNSNFVLHADSLGDRWTITSSGNITPVGWQRMGTFNASQTNSGEAWIGRASDRNIGTMTVQLGTDNSRVFEIVDYGWTTQIFVAGMNAFTYKGNTIWHAGNDGSGSGLDADLLDGNHASAFASSSHTHSYLPLSGGELSNGDSVTLELRPNDAGQAYLKVGRSLNGSQGTGIIEVTQDGSYGGGFYYNGDGSPQFISGESADTITFYRMEAGTKSRVFQYGYGSSVVDFISTPTVGGTAVSLNGHTHSYLPLSGGTMTGSINMSGTQNITYAGFAGIEYWNNSTWQVYIGTESNAAGARQNSRNGVHTWYNNGTQAMQLIESNLTIVGSLSAASKSFLIPHPTKEGWKLRYGSLEGPENGVYIRGKLKGKNVIELPEYWTKLVDPDSITVTLTPIGKHQKLYVEDIKDNKVYVGNDGLFAGEINCFFVVYGERVDIDKLVVEYE